MAASETLLFVLYSLLQLEHDIFHSHTRVILVCTLIWTIKTNKKHILETNILFWDHSLTNTLQWILVKTGNCIIFLVSMNCKSTSFKMIKSTFWIHNTITYFISLVSLQWFLFYCFMIVNRMFQWLQLFKRATSRNKIFLVGMTHNIQVSKINEITGQTLFNQSKGSSKGNKTTIWKWIFVWAELSPRRFMKQ